MQPAPLVVIPAWVLWNGLGLLAFGIIVVSLALWLDWLRTGRHRSQPRCPRCWYDMRGVSGLTCPECGKAARSPVHLLKSRRRWRLAAVGTLLALIGAGAASSRHLVNVPLLPNVPTVILVHLVDADPTPPYPNYNTPLSFRQRALIELWARYGRGDLSLSRRRDITARQFAQRPPFTLNTRPRWPAGVPVYATLTRSFNGATDRELLISPSFAGAQSIRTVEHSEWSTNWQCWPVPQANPDGVLHLLGTPPEGTTQISLTAKMTESGVPVWSGSSTIPLVVSGTLDDIITPVRDRDVDLKLKTQLSQSIRVSPDGRWMGLPRPTIHGVPRITLSFRVELLQGDTPVASAAFVLSVDAAKPGNANRSPWSHEPEPELWRRLEGDSAAIVAADLNDPSWSVRVVSDAEAALQDFDGTQYWMGVLSFPCPREIRDRSPLTSNN